MALFTQDTMYVAKVMDNCCDAGTRQDRVEKVKCDNECCWRTHSYNRLDLSPESMGNKCRHASGTEGLNSLPER